MHPALLMAGGGLAWLVVAIAVGVVVGKSVAIADAADARARRRAARRDAAPARALRLVKP